MPAHLLCWHYGSVLRAQHTQSARPPPDGARTRGSSTTISATAALANLTLRQLPQATQIALTQINLATDRNNTQRNALRAYRPAASLIRVALNSEKLQVIVVCSGKSARAGNIVAAAKSVCCLFVALLLSCERRKVIACVVAGAADNNKVWLRLPFARPIQLVCFCALCAGDAHKQSRLREFAGRSKAPRANTVNETRRSSAHLQPPPPQPPTVCSFAIAR